MGGSGAESRLDGAKSMLRIRIYIQYRIWLIIVCQHATSGVIQCLLSVVVVVVVVVVPEVFLHVSQSSVQSIQVQFYLLYISPNFQLRRSWTVPVDRKSAEIWKTLRRASVVSV